MAQEEQQCDGQSKQRLEIGVLKIAIPHLQLHTQMQLHTPPHHGDIGAFRTAPEYAQSEQLLPHTKLPPPAATFNPLARFEAKHPAATSCRDTPRKDAPRKDAPCVSSKYTVSLSDRVPFHVASQSARPLLHTPMTSYMLAHVGNGELMQMGATTATPLHHHFQTFDRVPHALFCRVSRTCLLLDVPCSVLQRDAVVLQSVASCCKVLQSNAECLTYLPPPRCALVCAYMRACMCHSMQMSLGVCERASTLLQHTATHCNTLQNALQHSVMLCNTLQHDATL